VSRRRWSLADHPPSGRSLQGWLRPENPRAARGMRDRVQALRGTFATGSCGGVWLVNGRQSASESAARSQRSVASRQFPHSQNRDARRGELARGLREPRAIVRVVVSAIFPTDSVREFELPGVAHAETGETALSGPWDSRSRARRPT
jgi:hypothetical protein